MKSVDLIRHDIATMEPYTPIFPFDVLAERLGRPPESIIKLDANENPYGPSPQVQEALSHLDYTHIYPDPESRALRRSLSLFTDLPAENLLAGAGADELLDLIMRLFLEAGDVIVSCPPTFGMYPFDAAVNAARTISVPRRDDFSLDINGIEKAVQIHKPKLLFIASPNNPDGSWLSDADLAFLLALPLVVVLDEAYVEFAGMRLSRIKEVLERDNLIVLRTFSKLAGLAGLRVGYGGFPVSLMPHLWKIKQPYNVSVAASTAAMTALGDLDWLLDKVELIIQEREQFFLSLQRIPYLRPYPSKSNFVLCQVLGRDAQNLKLDLEQQGILIRYYRTARLNDHVRFTIGKPEQMRLVLDALINLV
ncbi:MAG: histidinol-phosphate transaminase [Anaerolineae bacterium]|nr:histidinol-phosphate transaminase [Anaerolineae bacterium]